MLDVSEARKNEEVISMGSSQVLRWIDEINGIEDADARAAEIKTEIRRIKKEPSTKDGRKRIRQLYSELDSVQFKPDYMCLIIDKEKDYRRACKGFSINGVEYKRLLGTAGGIKNSTIVFVSDKVHDIIEDRINNGRDMSNAIVPAKLEAYKALACSASVPVSLPNGILVVKDAETEFVDDTVYLDDENDGEPSMEYKPGTVIHMDASDGFGLMLPSLAERWSNELGLEYTMSGCNTRFSFEKGMVYTFDFIDFAENVAHNNIVIDVWGNEVDIRQVELVLTESMLKLWDSYKSCEDYIENCLKNKYTIGIPKTCPEKLENERTLNYQFIQSYNLDDDDIVKLVSPSMNEIRDVLSDDLRKTILFLLGENITEKSISKIESGYIKAMMIDKRVYDDPYVKNAVYHLIRHRIDDAKIGVIKVHGNYSMASGDPYTLCQSIFGMDITGILKSGELYNKYWYDSGAERLACFRAPMSTHENIRVMNVCRNEDAMYWYRYMNTCTILNSWDNTTAAMNGMDFDGDLVMLTDNEVLIEKHRDLPCIMCVQRKAEKKVPTEEDTINSNIASFGNEIGQVTNRITSMYDVQSKFDPSTEEYKALSYRIMCGQLIQQNVIDKTKGIVAKPMPREWYDRHAVSKIDDNDKKNFYKSIVADKKPYFMRYIYPDLKKQYNTYISNTGKKALREFGMTVQQMKEMPYEKLTYNQSEFLRYYNMMLPVGDGNCVMNRICRMFEREFDGFIGKCSTKSPFDYSFMKSGVSYSRRGFYEIKSMYEEYNKRLEEYKIASSIERVDLDDKSNMIDVMKSEFISECDKVCPNSEELCDILLDICYSRSKTKRFVWDVCGYQIIKNLLKKNNNIVNYPSRDEEGDIVFCGDRFSMKSVVECIEEVKGSEL